MNIRKKQENLKFLNSILSKNPKLEFNTKNSKTDEMSSINISLKTVERGKLHKSANLRKTKEKKKKGEFNKKVFGGYSSDKKNRIEILDDFLKDNKNLDENFMVFEKNGRNIGFLFLFGLFLFLLFVFLVFI